MGRLQQCIFGICVFFFFCFSVKAEELTVVYPTVRAPYDAIFNNIKAGIESEFQGKISYVELPQDVNIDQVAQKIQSNKVITLGRRGLAVAKAINKYKTVLVGALPIKPNGVAGVSLAAAPVSLFESLNKLAPNIKTVYVLYSKSSEWIIEDAKAQAKNANLVLKPIAVADLRDAVKEYEQLFEQSDIENSAIWLPLDSITAHEKVVVPTILEKAWNKKMVVFSSKPIHAKRGALFSAMPHNKSMGAQLAKMLNNFNKNQKPSDVKPMKKIKLAVNLRTAAHLGLSYSKNQKSTFDLTFPK